MWKPNWSGRDRTNLYIVPASRYLEQELLAYQLYPSAVVIDWRKKFLDEVRPNQRRLGLTVAGELDRLRRITDSDAKVFSVINTEYLLGYFTEGERKQFWLSLWSRFPNLTGILIFTVLNSPVFLPDRLTLDLWGSTGRLAIAEKQADGARLL